ncbi:MAG: nucleoside deaminase [Candidatus Electrothrix sp. AR3]|nr:nucleoside deaminase [Candidatus Electrothrix sp. AR3]
MTTTQDQDYFFMEKALKYADQAALRNEVPVGAVLVSPEKQIIAGAGNHCIGLNDPTGHAEIHTLRAAAKKKGNYRLPGTTMYVTLEPCPMCAAAMIHARVERIVFGASDPKAGGVQSVYCIGGDGLLNHHFVLTGGVLADKCSRILKEFFHQRR